MTLTLSTRDVELVARVSRALMTPGLPTLEQWWLDTNRALLELFHGDHAMCVLPGTRLLTTQIDDGALAKIVAVSGHSGLRRLDATYFAVNAICEQPTPVTWNRVGTLRDAAVKRRRESAVYEAFRVGGIVESTNIDFTTVRGRVGLCVSFDRTDARTERSRLIAQLIAPAFEAGVQGYLRSAPILDVEGVLTPREREIATLLMQRRMNREIAALLGISEHTVRHHGENIFAKLGVRSRHDLAARLGVVE